MDHLWAPCASGADDDAYCGQVPTNPVSGYAVDDKTVMDEVIRTIRDGVGAAHRRPDFTFVNLHQVDSAGHATGTGPAYDTAIGQADDEIARLVGELQSRGEWERTVLILLSDHSMDTTLVKTNLKGAFTAGGISGERLRGGAERKRRPGLPGGPHIAEQLRAAQAHAGAGARQRRGRRGALPRAEPRGRRRSEHARGGAPGLAPDGARTGDLVVTHTPGGAFSDPGSFDNPLTGNHGGPHTRDNFFAVIGGGAGVRGQSLAGNQDVAFDDTLSNPGQAETVDVAPTVMGLFGLQPRARTRAASSPRRSTWVP